MLSRRLLIHSIPPGIVAGTRHGLLAKCLTPKLSDDDPPVEIFPYDTADGAYNSFSTQWERVFQAKSISEPLSSKFPLVCRGKHGLILAHAWASHYVNLTSATAEDIGMIIPRLEALLLLIPAAVKAHKEIANRKPADSSDDDEEFPAVVLSSAKAAGIAGAEKGKTNKITAPKEKAPSKKAKTGGQPPSGPSEDRGPISLVSEDEAVPAKANPKVRPVNFVQGGRLPASSMAKGTTSSVNSEEVPSGRCLRVYLAAPPRTSLAVSGLGGW
ncbi:hypothetical protein B0H14DRAFT_3892262 [Mycena olivaceomarginata]|nr:hypothetical protein B0H14DRAFT_3892262 [Mycena olivaceomarginata]